MVAPVPGLYRAPSFHHAGHPGRGGFTLIEMLVVMTLIALLLTLAVPRYFGSVDSGKLTVQRQNLATIRDAIDKFSADLGRYPDSLDELVAKHYLRRIPVDPVSELATWTIVAPADPTQGSVYDVTPSSSPASAPAGAPAAAPAASGSAS
jgi:general secretion pathway protein G